MNLHSSLYKLLVFNLLFLTGISYAQVEDVDVMLMEHPTDSSAIAEYIHHSAWVKFEATSQGPFLVTQHKEIIKIYDTKGEKFADFRIGMYKERSSKEKVSGVKGTTYNYVNGKVEKTKLEKSDIFTEEKSDKLKYTVWAMPDVRPGSVIEIKYSIRSPWIYTIDRFNFQYEIPVRDVEYIIQIPSYFTYTPIATGIVPIEKKEEFRRGDYGEESMFIFKAKNIPALKKDNFVLNIEDYRSSLKYELHSAVFPGQATQSYSKSWNDIANNLQDHEKFGKQLRKKLKNYQDFITEVSSLDRESKIKKIYDHVRTEYTWNETYGKYTDEGLNDLVKTKSGNIADINILLINLLNKAGIEALPLLLKSRNYGLMNELYPSVSELNYMAVYVDEGDGKFAILDATSKYYPIGQLPTRALNINGLLLRGDKGEVVGLTNNNTYSYQALTKYEVDVENAILIGEGNSVRKNFGATQYRINLDSKEEDEDEEDTEDDSEEEDDEYDDEYEEEIFIDNESNVVSVEGVEDIYQPIKVGFNEKLYDVIDVIGNQVFINATLDFGMDENPFIEKERKMPIFYRSKNKIRNVAYITLPEGYVVESLPAPVKMRLEDRSVIFSYGCQESAGKITINYSFEVKSDFYSSVIYPNLKEIYDRIISKSKEKIVLKKA